MPCGLFGGSVWHWRLGSFALFGLAGHCPDVAICLENTPQISVIVVDLSVKRLTVCALL